MSGYIQHNELVQRAGEPIVTAGNRSFRYGDGCFETMLLQAGRIDLWTYHMDRLFRSLQLLQIVPPAPVTPAYLYASITALAAQNGHSACARVRLNCWRDNTTDNRLSFVIETFAWEPEKTGLIVDIYPFAQKSCDRFASLKSNNYLLYSMATQWARAHQAQEAIVLNTFGRVADATIANVFLVQDGQTITPPLSEGCVDGVMRRHLMATYEQAGNRIVERPVTPEALLQADEVFLTNALRGKISVQWPRK
jgi:branched-subunit amino acid aminotransferase/4-amino-4-deoxychorismate lyase